VRAETGRTVNLHRVRWRRPHWRLATATRVRYFAAGAFARRFAARLRAEGAAVELSVASVPIAWVVVDDDA
jgi:hypothetical protein